MRNFKTGSFFSISLMLICFLPAPVFAQKVLGTSPGGAGLGISLLIIGLIAATLFGAVYLVIKTTALKKLAKKQEEPQRPDLKKIVSKFNRKQTEVFLKKETMKENKIEGKPNNPLAAILLFLIPAALFSTDVFAQAKEKGSLFTEGGIIITLILIVTPILVGIILMILKVNKMTHRYKIRKKVEEAQRIQEYLESLPADQVEAQLRQRQETLNYELQPGVLAGTLPPQDSKGLLKNVNEHANIRFIEEKRRAIQRPHVNPELSKLIIWYLVSATLWLIFGTTVGEYVGIKFVAPDADSVSWLSFGRLRPVHTNAVFWGWSSLGMLGLAYYVVPRVGNNQIFSLKLGWIALWCVNLGVLLGSITLMLGINNSGGEFREYLWPFQLLFGIGVILSLINFLKTIARRKTREIYVSNWYIVAAMMFGITIFVVGYLPFWQKGLGETITQGYYMHQAVGMWFMMFTLGLIYYFLPQQLNRPIYSYSLGILAFWSQIFFYTTIGTHHFVFSAIPWWLQTVAIVGSVGMIIPVVSGTTNFVLTFKGSWHKLSGSYTLPFFLIGIIFYFTGSMQGTAEAFRTTNLYWHFTDFTVAHSHLTMYGIIAFFLWGFIYALVPRLTRKEPPQATVGIHFWLAFIGLLFYSIPLMIGGTLKGISWMEGKPFIDSVIQMAPYWLWRAIGGTLMWASHLVFAYNMYKMIAKTPAIDIHSPAAAFVDNEDELVKMQ